MIKRFIFSENSFTITIDNHTLIIDKSILDMLKKNPEKTVRLKADGKRVLLEPISDGDFDLEYPSHIIR